MSPFQMFWIGFVCGFVFAVLLLILLALYVFLRGKHEDQRQRDFQQADRTTNRICDTATHLRDHEDPDDRFIEDQEREPQEEGKPN